MDFLLLEPRNVALTITMRRFKWTKTKPYVLLATVFYHDSDTGASEEGFLKHVVCG